MKQKAVIILSCFILSVFSSCYNEDSQKGNHYKKIGSIESLHKDLDKIINPTAKIEVLADSLTWSEGPIWVSDQKMLLFSDVPENKIFKWTAENGVELYLHPSGYTGDKPRGGETGSNGLLVDQDGNLILCQHGDRRLAMMDAPLSHPQAKFKTIADTYEEKKMNSPNDVVQKSNGDLFFTDPPYGLNDQDIETQELTFQGVYKFSKRDSSLTLLIDSLSRPNGIGFGVNEKVLLVANSDENKPYLYGYECLENDSLKAKGVLFDFSKSGEKGVPDGFAVDQNGNIFSSGPGGVWILNSDYEAIGRIKLPNTASNCFLADDDKTLFITADTQVLRLKMR